MSTATATSSNAPVVRTGALFGAGFQGGAIAAVVNVVLLFGAGALGVSFEGQFQPDQPVASLGLVPVILSSIVPALPGALLALVLLKVAPARAALVFAIIAAVFTVVSFGGPANVKGLSMGGIVVMELMHVVAAAGIGGFIWRRLSAR